MAQMGIDIRGRVKNFPLNKSQTLAPLFEAVVNSIHAIEEKQVGQPEFRGEITVQVVRENVLATPNEQVAAPHVIGFDITDDGIGFNELNYDSFLRSDSQYKQDKGGKGVGRLCWLKVFKRAHVLSNFLSDEGLMSVREFNFSLDDLNVDGDTVELSDAVDSGTTVSLQHVEPEFADYMPDDPSRIATSLMYHCIVYLLSETCPIIHVVDGDTKLCVNRLFKDALSDKGEERDFTVFGDRESVCLKLHCLKMNYELVPRSQGTHPDKLILSAHHRAVETLALDRKLNGLCALLHEQHNTCFIGVVTGGYLDDSVDMNRLSFIFPNATEDQDSFFGVTKTQIVDRAVDCVKDFLSEYQREANANKAERIEAFVNGDGQQYKHLLDFAKPELNELPYKPSPEAIDDAFYKARRRLKKDTDASGAALLKKLSDTLTDDDAEKLQSAYETQLRQLTMLNYTALGEYVIRRKSILDFFEAALRRNEDGKFHKEKVLHNLIYPMGESSDTVGDEGHNMWLIDERLTYSMRISSDQTLKYEGRRSRPDIMVVDGPVEADKPIVLATEDYTGKPYESVIIFELKKPMRDDYTDSSNPITQLYDYARQIRTGNTYGANGRQIRVSDSTRLYLYAVCDLTPSLKPILEYFDFEETPDGMGYFRVNGSLNAYVEILSFDKIVLDAKARNAVFFRKLGLNG